MNTDVMVRADDICWSLERLPLLERVDPLTLDDHESLEYLRQLQTEVTALRAFAHVALNRVHSLERDNATLRQTVRQLRRPR